LCEVEVSLSSSAADEFLAHEIEVILA